MCVTIEFVQSTDVYRALFLVCYDYSIEYRGFLHLVIRDLAA